jgi:GNAT superfamily N-acetyltransferase
MTEPDLSVEDAPSDADVAFVQDQLHAYNIATTGYADYRPLAIFLRDDAGEIIAGLIGFTWGGTLKIETLWVRSDERGRDLGSHLVQAAEREAIARGCKQTILETHSFQAPGFYPKLGYIQCGLAEDWPVGHQHHYFHKRL